MSNKRDTLKPGVYLLAVDSYLVIRPDRPAVFCQYVDPEDFRFVSPATHPQRFEDPVKPWHLLS